MRTLLVVGLALLAGGLVRAKEPALTDAQRHEVLNDSNHGMRGLADVWVYPNAKETDGSKTVSDLLRLRLVKQRVPVRKSAGSDALFVVSEESGIPLQTGGHLVTVHLEIKALTQRTDGQWCWAAIWKGSTQCFVASDDDLKTEPYKYAMTGVPALAQEFAEAWDRVGNRTE